MSSLSPLEILRLGRIPYEEALGLQERLERKRLDNEIPDTAIVLEHPPVITLGHRGDDGNVIASDGHLQSLGIEIHRTSRGGDVTYHGPGQVVVYPIVDLHAARMGAACFVEILEESMIRTASDLKVTAIRLPGKRGIFVNGDKLGAVGVHISHGVTTHGLALNNHPDLSHFELIVPCGLRDHSVTSFREILGRTVDGIEVEDRLVEHLASLLAREIVMSSTQAMS